MEVGKVGDKVVCSCNGGPHSIVSGAMTVFVDNVPVARVGDRTSCGATITTGLAWYLVEDSPVAINGSATSCGGHIITGSTAITGAPSTISLGDGLRFRQVDDPEAELQAEMDRINDETSRAREEGQQVIKESGIEPGFHVVRSPGTREEIKRRLFGTPRPDVEAMFERLNRHLGDYVLPGSLVVLSDPENRQCSAEEAALQDQAHLAQAVIQQLEPAQAQAMINSWGAIAELKQASEAAGSASTSLGVGSSGLGQLKHATEAALDEMAQLAEVGSERISGQGKATLRRLGDQATNWVDQPFEMPEMAKDLKNAIGVKAEQAVHSVRQAMEGLHAFRVPTISDAIRSAGRIVKPLSYANYFAIGLDYTSTSLKVESACRQAATSEECRKVKFVEYGGFALRTVGGGMGASLGNICLITGVTPTTLACALAVGGAGALGGMEAGDEVGQNFGEFIYNLTEEDSVKHDR
ncbi:PAAR domain-containing protein [Halomonas elongata]|uniref:PAAR domain-containing protein n=1 Tax=Halomonas elongata TaxID=2746 RepID=UPI0023AF6368|nr:PAAR domain-containing protein [Halomonas elongata]